jgi:YHS domain-containing protein
MNPTKSLLIATSLIASVITFTGCQSTEHDHSTHSHSHTSAAATPYSLKTCLVTDDALDKDAFTFVHKGQEVKLCCEGCREDFDKNPSKYLKKLAAK